MDGDRGSGFRDRWWWGLIPDARSLIPILLAGCTVTPLTNRIEVGEEPFVIAVGEGADGATDLYAASAGGGRFHRLTFNRRRESHPELAPSGTLVLFLAGRPEVDDAPSVVVLSLISNAERVLALPSGALPPERAGWDGDSVVVIRTRDGRAYALAAPPAPSRGALLEGPARARAESSLAVLVGDPPFAAAEPCGAGLCIRLAPDSIALLEPRASGAVRWGADSVGYFGSAGFVVRPLGGGRERRPGWTPAPRGLREVTYHSGTGQATTDTGGDGER